MIDNSPQIEKQFQQALAPDGKTIRGFALLNVGKTSLLSCMTLIELNHYSEVANNRMSEDEQSQRALDLSHATKLAMYFLKALLDSAINNLIKRGKPVSDYFRDIQKKIGKQNYYTIAPIVTNLRTAQPEDIRPWVAENKIQGYFITLNIGDTLWVIDGQHRRKAIDIVIDFLKYVNSNYKYPGKGGLFSAHKNRLSRQEIEVWTECRDMCSFCQVAVEIHLGLDIDEERQLFYDLNNLGKKVDQSLANKFDSSNPVNNYVTDVLSADIFPQHNFEVLDSSSESDWTDKKPSLTRRSLSAINAVLFLNKGNINGATPSAVTDEKKVTANQYWTYILSIPGFLDDSPKLKTVAAQPVVLKAIAKLYFDSFFGKNESLNNIENREKLLNGLKSFDFGHDNLAWRYYSLSHEERDSEILAGLSNYLPIDGDGSNRDMGAYDQATNTFRFGAKHNDISPLIGDIIRWHCQLPSRQK